VSRSSRRAAIAGGLGIALALTSACEQKPDPGIDENVTALGSIEVTARLVEIRGVFRRDPFYNYVYIMRYRVLTVHRGTLNAQEIFVGQYNPHKSRPKAADHLVKGIGGNLRRFRAGDVHRMALEVPLDDYYIGGIINKYHGETTGPLYWAVWTNLVIL